MLTHQRELNKASNTGKLVLDVLQHQAAQVVWDRTAPEAALIEAISAGHTALLYPQSTSDQESTTDKKASVDIREIENFIIIDSTWQQARKIYNKSPYLKNASIVTLTPSEPSAYRLRRNQQTDGLCTAECAIEILRIKGRRSAAWQLEQQFMSFNRGYG